MACYYSVGGMIAIFEYFFITNVLRLSCTFRKYFHQPSFFILKQAQKKFETLLFDVNEKVKKEQDKIQHLKIIGNETNKLDFSQIEKDQEFSEILPDFKQKIGAEKLRFGGLRGFLVEVSYLFFQKCTPKKPSSL